MTPQEAAVLLRVFGFRPTPEQAADCARAVLLTEQYQLLTMRDIGAARAARTNPPARRRRTQPRKDHAA